MGGGKKLALNDTGACRGCGWGLGPVRLLPGLLGRVGSGEGDVGGLRYSNPLCPIKIHNKQMVDTEVLGLVVIVDTLHGN